MEEIAIITEPSVIALENVVARYFNIGWRLHGSISTCVIDDQIHYTVMMVN